MFNVQMPTQGLFGTLSGFGRSEIAILALFFLLCISVAIGALSSPKHEKKISNKILYKKFK